MHGKRNLPRRASQKRLSGRFFRFPFEIFSHRLCHRVMDIRLAPEADLVLCRMDVDVHLLKGNFQVNNHRGIATFH